MRILENRGNWYKGNLHMHTTLSDGALDPVEAINIYREAGYDFIAITDHRKVGHLWQDDSFLILPGVEWDTGDAVYMPVYHILGIGMDRDTVDFYHGAPYEGAPLGNARAGLWVGSQTGRKPDFKINTKQKDACNLLYWCIFCICGIWNSLFCNLADYISSFELLSRFYWIFILLYNEISNIYSDSTVNY